MCYNVFKPMKNAPTHILTPELTLAPCQNRFPNGDKPGLERGQVCARPQGSDLRIANGQKAIRKRAQQRGDQKDLTTLSENLLPRENYCKLCWGLEWEFGFIGKVLLEFPIFELK